MPQLIKGDRFEDERGVIKFNNEFDLREIKRIYTIENSKSMPVRAWQGHKVEKRWFSVSTGSFLIKVIALDNWSEPAKNLPKQEFFLNSNTCDVLEVEEGHVTFIQSLEENSKLLVFSNYILNEIDDEYKFDKDYFL